MYIKLGQTAINKVASVDDFMIISEVLDSDLSLEYPALVRTVDELDVWFGKNLKERDFLVELLQSGITLYLYKPISTSSWGIDTIDYDSYTSVTFLGMETISDYYIQYFNEFKHQGSDVVYKTKGVGPRNTIIDKYVYWNGTNFVDASAEKVSKSKHWYVGSVEPTINTLQMGIIKRNNNIKINVNTAVKREGETETVQTELYVWYDDQLVETSLLPQNIQNYSVSLNNRSTLLLTKSISDRNLEKENESKVQYYYPEYRIDENNLVLEHPEWLKNLVFSETKLDQERMDKGLQTGFLNLSLNLNSGEYVMLPLGNTGENICISNGNPNLPSGVTLDNDKKITDLSSVTNIETFLNNHHYFFNGNIEKASGTGTKFVAEIKDLYYSTGKSYETMSFYGGTIVQKAQEERESSTILPSSNRVADILLNEVTGNIIFEDIVLVKSNGEEVKIPSYEEGDSVAFLIYGVYISNHSENVITITAKNSDPNNEIVSVRFKMKNAKTEIDENDTPEINTVYQCSFRHVSDEIETVPVQEFSNSSKTIFEVDNYNNQVLLSQSVSSESRAIEFWSKTIGGYDEIEAEEGLDIIVTVEELEEENLYRVSLQRYEYLEVFEGYTVGSIYTESLDSKISRESRLVYCNLLSNKLPIGTWKLKGGVKETKTPKMWMKALNELYNERAESLCPDFFLVPDVKKYIFDEKSNNFISYISSENDPSYLPIYQTFLDLARTCSCQFLFQNSYYPINRTISYVKIKVVVEIDSEGNETVMSTETYEFNENTIPNIPNTIFGVTPLKETWSTDGKKIREETLDTEIYATDEKGDRFTTNKEKAIAQKLYETEGNEFIYNYIDDYQNNLVYFYRDMTISGKQKPGYYAFLYGLFTNNYSISSKVLIYKEPNENPYTEDTLEELLIKKKSNYLVSNNQEYYYKRYLSGKKYIDTIWMKFAAGKIKREMVKNQGLYLGRRFVGQMERDIENVLNRITATFSIVGKITLTRLVKNEKIGALSVYISAEVNDLISNNISLNVTINYNNQTNT